MSIVGRITHSRDMALALRSAQLLTWTLALASFLSR